MDDDSSSYSIVAARTTDTTDTSRSRKSFFGSIIRKETKVSEASDSSKGKHGLTVLHEPDVEVPAADLVFVHGLNGGSQSTWTKGPESNFWPKEWLPHDDAFADVRIHTFGYPSGISRESILNIKDFARSLLCAIHDAPTIPRRQNVPLIFIGHSMGGLVIKQAYVLGHRTPEFDSVVQRVQAMFFLGVPHQGAEVAQTLNRLLSLHGARPFVNDLFPSSPELASINDEFPHLSRHLRLFSFFETRPINYGVGKGLIVEKHAAVLNYTNERRTYLDANHRDVARFASATDPSYLTVRNALATSVNDQRDEGYVAKNDIRESDSAWEDVDSYSRESLSKFLGVDDAPEDDLMHLDSLRLPGSCEWLLQRPSFVKWRDIHSSGLYWLRGRPGAGKSIISSAVVSHLREHNHDCCFFFFVHGDKNKVAAKSFLKSLAFQMATLHSEILQLILDIVPDWGEASFDKNDTSVIWRKLFLTGIFKVKLNRPQYWVIDALDEARGGTELVSFLLKAQEYWPLCIFVTSRNSIDSHTGLLTISVDIVSEIMTEDDNSTDIGLFLDRNCERFPVPTHEGRSVMAQRILQNARGCFLWAQLVVKELLQVRTTAQANRVIESNPSDMDSLYLNILHDMSETKFNQDLVKAILTWAACSSRPLHLDELQHAIQLDIRDEVGDMERSINDSCGNLVYVDKSKKLQFIHLTAREFLIRRSLDSEYKVDRDRGHRQLALICLEYLVGQEARTISTSRFRKPSLTSQQQDKSPFAEYATCFLFHHLYQAKSCDDQLLITLTNFLKSANILVWIEQIARRSDLQTIFLAGKTIGHILQRRGENSPPIGLRAERECLEQWASDLTRLVTKFGKRLKTTPYAIHHLIPAFCPHQSAIHEQFCTPRGISVIGVGDGRWDDCLSTMSFAKPARPHVIVTSSTNIAIGVLTGKVTLYDHSTFQETTTIEHSEPVWALAFSDNGMLVAVAGARSVCVWDIEKDVRLQTFQVKTMCLALAFGDNDKSLWVALRNNTLLCWDIDSGELHNEPINWTADFEEGGPDLHARAPVMAVFCMHLGLLAIVYRGEDLVLWELAEERVFDIYEKDTGSRLNGSTKIADGVSTVWDVAFSAAPGTCLLAATYFDGDLIVYDIESGNVVHNLPAVNSQKLCSSPDGRTLASGDSSGTIQLFDFQTMKLLYKIQFQADAMKIRTLAFTFDNLRLIEIRGNQCRVWEPSVLLRQDADDNSSDTVSVSTAPVEIEFEASQASNITAMTCTNLGPVVFCGKDDGTVHAYSISQGLIGQELFIQTRNCPIILLHFDPESDILTCCDAATRVTARRVTQGVQKDWSISDILLDTRPARKVLQLLSCGRHNRLLLSTDEHCTLWPLGAGTDKSAYVKRIEGSIKPSWVSHMDSKTLILVGDTGAKTYNWLFLEQLASISFTSMDPPLVSSIIALEHPRFFATVAKDSQSGNTSARSAIHVWDMNDFSTQEPQSSVKPAFDLGTLAVRVEQAIGVYNDRLVFLDKDHWVCSIDLARARAMPSRRGVTTGRLALGRRQSEAAPRGPPGSGSDSNSIVRHFFVPYDWISMVSRLHVGLGKGGEILFVKRSELAVVKRGLEFCESGPFHARRGSMFNGLPSRPALSSTAPRDRHSV